MKKVLMITVVSLLAINLFNPAVLHAQMSAYKLHSLFVYNFVKNIKWENVGDEFVIGVYAKADALREFKDNFSNKNFGGKKFNVKSISEFNEASECQILYIPRSNLSKTKAIISALKDQNILVVTEDDLIAEGASISFELIDSKLNFKISKSKTEDKGLKVSSSLLALGTVVG